MFENDVIECSKGIDPGFSWHRKYVSNTLYSEDCKCVGVSRRHLIPFPYPLVFRVGFGIE
jgi:hypothetical protein